MIHDITVDVIYYKHKHILPVIFSKNYKCFGGTEY